MTSDLDDPDFPAPKINDKVFRDYVAANAFGHLELMADASATGAAWGAWNWLSEAKAGLPLVPLVEEAVRQEALMWAEMATPPELQAYVVAGIDALAPGPFSSRQIKRLVAALWGRMTPDEQEAFKGWINERR